MWQLKARPRERPGYSAAVFMLLTFSASGFTLFFPECTVKFTDNVSTFRSCVMKNQMWWCEGNRNKRESTQYSGKTEVGQ